MTKHTIGISWLAAVLILFSITAAAPLAAHPVPLQSLAQSLSGHIPREDPGSVPAVDAVTYYVATTGSDTNPGTSTQPWRTIQHAVGAVQPGDTILVRTGTYNEAIALRLTASSTQPIRLAAEVARSVTINGGSSAAVTFTDNSSYWAVEGFILRSTAQYAARILTHNSTLRDNQIIGAVYVRGAYNLLEENELDGSLGRSSHGFMDDSEGSHHNIVRGNYIHHFSERGIWSQWRTHDNIFEYNRIELTSADRGMCIDIDGATNVEWRHLIRGNFLINCGKSGISLENTFATLVESNTIIHTSQEGIEVINYGPTSYSHCEVGGENNQYGDTDGDRDCRGDLTSNILRQNVIIRAGSVGGITSYRAGGVEVLGNTIISGRGPGLYLNAGADMTPGWTLRGNIFASNYRVEVSLQDAASIIADDHNLFHHPDNNRHIYEVRSLHVFYPLADYRLTYDLGQFSIQADPRFVDMTNNNLRLRADSPAVDRGRDLGTSLDLDQNPRPMGFNYDIGAFEYPAAGLVAHPPAARTGQTVSLRLILTGSGAPGQLTLSLPPSLEYNGVSTTCPGGTTYSPAQRVVGYAGTIEANKACSLDVETMVTGAQPELLLLSAVWNGQSYTAAVVLNGLQVFLPLAITQP